MSTCARCGVALGEPRYPGANLSECSDEDCQWSEGYHYQQCIERQLSNLRSLLRSVTGKLERAREMLDGANRGEWEVQKIIDSVLEALS